jgi:phage shock protein PspC (stress-responsive transcriptional regulator)
MNESTQQQAADQQQEPGPTTPDLQPAPTRFDRGSAATAVRHPESLRRSSTDRKVAGVCGGLGRQLGVDPNILRVAAVALALSGIGIALYLILWIVMPDEGQPEGTGFTTNLPEQLRSGTGLGVAIAGGTVLLGIALQAVFGSVLPFGFPIPFPLLLVAGVIWFFAHRSRGQTQRAVTSFQAEHPAGPRLDLSRDPDDPGAPGPEFWARPDPLGLYPREQAPGSVVQPVLPARISRKAPALLRLGTVVATAAGVAVLVIVSGAGVAVPALLFVGVPLAIFGAGLMLTSRFGTSGGLATLGVAAAVAAAGITGASAGPWHVTDQHPLSVQDANSIVLPMGINNIDLSKVPFTLTSPSTIHLNQHNGALIVQVPDNVDVKVTAEVNRGGYDLFGTDGGGRPGNRTNQAPVVDNGPDGNKFGSDPILNLDLTASNGFVRVERAG